VLAERARTPAASNGHHGQQFEPGQEVRLSFGGAHSCATQLIGSGACAVCNRRCMLLEGCLAWEGALLVSLGYWCTVYA